NFLPAGERTAGRSSCGAWRRSLPLRTPRSHRRVDNARLGWKFDFQPSSVIPGVEIAGTWLDEECGAWALSTVPVRRFSTEREAIDYFRNKCDPETGLPLQVLGSFG